MFHMLALGFAVGFIWGACIAAWITVITRFSGVWE